MKKIENDVCIAEPIIAGIGLGNLKLKDHIKYYYDVITKYTFEEITPYSPNFFQYAYLRSPYEIVYKLAECIEATFHTMNGKLMRIDALKGYKGLYKGKIYVGMPLQEALSADLEFLFDSYDEVYKKPNEIGISINQDPHYKYVESISVYIEEMDAVDLDQIRDFKKGNW